MSSRDVFPRHLPRFHPDPPETPDGPQHRRRARRQDLELRLLQGGPVLWYLHHRAEAGDEERDGDGETVLVAPNGKVIGGSETDVRARQILERVDIEALEETVERIERPKSEIKRREVYVKETKAKQAVRKLLVWKTNKEEVDDDYPAWVVHWTDYSPGRKEPIQRTVRPAPDEETAMEVAEELLEKGVKRGWEKVAEG